MVLIAIVLQMLDEMVRYCLPSRAATCKDTLNLAKIQYKLRVSSGLNLFLYGSMEWNVEENFRMEWKIFSIESKKTASMEYGKIVFHSISYHALLTGRYLPVIAKLSSFEMSEVEYAVCIQTICPCGYTTLQL